MHRLEVRRVAEPAEGGLGAQGGEGSLVTITAECDRYLMNMMRLVAGTLVEVGLRRLAVDDVAALLGAHSRASLQKHGGPRVYKAPARGLCLDRCFYPGDDDEHDLAWPRSQPTGSEDAHAEREGERPAAPHGSMGASNVCMDHRIKN